MLIMKWKRLYIQKEDADGMKTLGAKKDTISEWGMYCAELDWMVGGSAKELPENDWADEDGKDVWMPEGGIPLKSYDTSLTFYCKGDAERAKRRINAMLDFLTGRDGSGCWMRIYSEYSMSGRGGVRFDSMETNPEFVMTNRGIVGKVTVKFHIDRPQSNIILSNGELVDSTSSQS